MVKTVEYKGKEYTYSELAKFNKEITANTIRMRIKNGWSVDLAVETPKMRNGKPICGAKSFYDCFTCRFDDCIVNIVYFDDSPWLTEHY